MNSWIKSAVWAVAILLMIYVYAYSFLNTGVSPEQAAYFIEDILK